jgi:hypothetical protein
LEPTNQAGACSYGNSAHDRDANEPSGSAGPNVLAIQDEHQKSRDKGLSRLIGKVVDGSGAKIKVPS